MTLRRPDGSLHTDDTTVDADGISPEWTDLQQILRAATDKAITRTMSVA